MPTKLFLSQVQASNALMYFQICRKIRQCRMQRLTSKRACHRQEYRALAKDIRGSSSNGCETGWWKAKVQRYTSMSQWPGTTTAHTNAFLATSTAIKPHRCKSIFCVRICFMAYYYVTKSPCSINSKFTLCISFVLDNRQTRMRYYPTRNQRWRYTCVHSERKSFKGSW